MSQRRISPRLVALLVYALAVNAILWAQAAVANIDARHALCGPAAVAGTQSARFDGAGAHACCDLACAVQGTLAPPAFGLTLVHHDGAPVEGPHPATMLARLHTAAPNARGPPAVL